MLVNYKIYYMNMDSNNGFVYVRQHVYYENDKICKLGKSKNIPDRDNGYATGEYRRGKFGLVIKNVLPNHPMMINYFLR